MNLIKSTAVVSFFTLLSRVSGFFRDLLIARWFGVSVWTDAFFVVFKIPNFMRRLFAEGSFSLAFVPVLNEIKAMDDRQYLKKFVDHIFGTLLAVLLVVLALLELLAPGVLAVFGPGLHPEVIDGSVQMLRLTLPYLLFISLVAFCGGVLNSFQKFAVPAMTPILLNVSLISAAFWLRDDYQIPIMSLAVGVFIAGVAQLVIQVPAMIKLGMLPVPRFSTKDKEVRKVMKLMLPTLFGSSVAQINLMVDTIIATMLPLVGSVTFLYYADRLVEFPLGLFGIAISTVILPKLSYTFASKQHDEFLSTMKWALSMAILIAIPSAVGLFVLAKPVVVSLFEYGKFTAEHSHQTAISLMVYMIGLPAFVLNKVLLPVFFARKDTVTPVKIAIKSMTSNMLMNFLFVYLLWLAAFESLHVGLALASSCAAWLQSILLSVSLKKDAVLDHTVVPVKLLLKVIIASVIMAFVLVFFNQFFPDWHSLNWLNKLMNLSALIAIGAGSYLILMFVFKVKVALK